MRVLFWNTHNNSDINQILHDLIVENNISVVVLAEYNDKLDYLTASLQKSGITMWQYITAGCERIKVLGNIECIEPAIQTQYVSMHIINKKDILCCVHLPSQIYTGNEGMRNIIINSIVTDIRALEMRNNTENTMVVGDFNINPYDEGCVNADLFHGIPIYMEAKRGSRVIAGKEFHMFYNPMWNLLGDFKEPYGTYYYAGSSVNNTYWHFYDQVIIRPALKKRFVDESLEIITHTQTINFLNSKGHPDKEISDHLPIVFEIKEDYCG